MAEYAVQKSRYEVEQEAREALQTEALQRLEDARREKRNVTNDHQNAYFYAAPRRIRQQQSQSQTPAPTKPGDDRQLQTSFGFEVVDDFMSMLIQTFTPREGPWAERKLPEAMRSDDFNIDEVNEAIRLEDEKVFNLIRASNYYSEKAMTGVPDAAVGIVALLVTDPGRGQPYECRGVPIRELEIDKGPDGRPDFRAIVRVTKFRYLKAEVGAEVYAKIDPVELRKYKDQPDQPIEVVWAWWRIWDNLGDHEYQHVVLCQQKLCHQATSIGEGSCALIVGRFGATPDFAWPDGPLLKSLADLVQLDEVRGALIENLDFTLRPPKAYDDDGVINLPTDGVRPGELYPRRPSYGKQTFEDIYQPRAIDSALFEIDHLTMRIRRLHYVDFPEQKGKTPPTATQWIDELAIRQNRIGTPGFAFWREEPYEAFQRFRYLGEKGGKVRPLDALGVRVPLQPYNPAERAQDSQDISTSVRFAQIGQAIAPTIWQVAIDELATLQNIRKKMRVTDVVLRDQGEIEQRVKLLASLGTQMTGQGGGDQGGAPPS